MNTTKLQKQSRIFIMCAFAVVIGFLTYLAATALSFGSQALTPAGLLHSIPFTVFAALNIFHAFMLLRSVAKNDSPFKAQNVRHLQWIGWLFIAFEPAAYLCQSVSNRFFPITLGNGVWMTTTETYGGVFLICGFVILTVSTIFRYGMELQQLSDETL